MPSFLPPTTLRRRVFLSIFILLAVSAVGLPLYFATRVQAVSTTVVISEFRVRGPNGGNDELIELYNLTNSPINIGGWKINGSNNAGTASTRLTINAGTTIPAHGHFLAVNNAASGYSGSVTGNQSYTTGVTDDGGIALLDAGGLIIDQVGMNNGSAYKEGTVLASLGSTTASNLNRCYERKPGGVSGSTQDADNNSTDFQLITPCDPQNLASAPTPAVVNPGTLQFSASTYSVNENGGSATITVTRTGGSSGAVSVNYATGGGSATAGDDYVTTSGTVSFDDGDTANKTFTVTINDDPDYEGNETVNLSLSSPTGGATLGSPSAAALTIVENDPQPNQQISPTCPTSLTTTEGNATAVGVSATDPDGTVTSAKITSAPVAGITLDNFTPAASSGGTATATLNVANTTAPGTYNVLIQYSNNDSPTPQTASCTVAVTVNAPPTPAAVVISQVYGGGGNTGATLKNDYIELLNHSSSPVSLNGWSVQAFVSNPAPGAWVSTPLPNFTLQPGQYFLVQESQGAGGTDSLPTPDAIGTIAVSSTSTKVALLSNTTTLTGACPNPATAGIVDLVGYGPATGTGAVDCFEGSGPAPTLNNTTAAFRLSDGCFDTDDNAHDFGLGSPNPRNSSSAANVVRWSLGPWFRKSEIRGSRIINASDRLRGTGSEPNQYRNHGYCRSIKHWWISHPSIQRQRQHFHFQCYGARK